MKAFPQQDSNTYDPFKDRGMDLRDYFAAHAPDIPLWFKRKETSRQEILTTVQNGERRYYPHTYIDSEPSNEYFIRWRYAYADMMMKARMNDSTS